MPTKEEIKKFSLMVEELVSKDGSGYMDAICHYCKETGLEIEVAATLISSSLKSKIREEAQEFNLLKKNSKLPI